MRREMAEELALDALIWILEDDGLSGVFLGATGIASDDLRAQAKSPETLAAVLDFLLMDDAWIKGFCTDSGRDYTAVAEARQALPGGDLPNWT
ncbi:MAG: DUF3572 domain-containing protein [Pseudomonadota bacterium]